MVRLKEREPRGTMLASSLEHYSFCTTSLIFSGNGGPHDLKLLSTRLHVKKKKNLKPGMVTRACNPSIGELETGRFLSSLASQPRPFGESQALKNKVDSTLGATPHIRLSSGNTQRHVHTCRAPTKESTELEFPYLRSIDEDEMKWNPDSARSISRSQ